MIPLVRALDRIADGLGTVAAAAAAVILAAVSAHILLEIFLRNVFDSSTYAVDELVGFGVGAMTILAMAQTFRRGEMIRVHILLARLSEGPRRATEVICSLLALIPVALTARAFVTSTLRNLREGSVSTGLLEVPLWIPEAIFAFGLLLLAFQLVTYAARLMVESAAPIFASDVTTE